jgi:hypothetical protein
MDLTYSSFFDQELLETEYLRRHRDAYEKYFEEGLVNKYRCYPVIVEKLQSIFEYNERHAKYLAKRIKTQQGDMRSCEAVVSEVIVYSHYIPLIKQGFVTSLDIVEDDYDLKIGRPSRPDVFLEIFCIMPNFREDDNGVFEVKTHTQTADVSVRQKLLWKMRKQKQMQKVRENWAVIELNDMSIAGEFTVPSSLSGGYKIAFSPETTKIAQSGFDWSDSVFDAPETQNLHGVMYFSLGHYEARGYILNGRIRNENVDEELTIP